MKFTRTKLFLLAAFVSAGSFSARAQSNSASDETDYGKYAGFITDRNIFDPNRYPHNQRGSSVRTKRTKTRSNGPQGITFVGTMAYEKGDFAFFNAGDPDLKKVVSAGDAIADYTVKDISATAVTLIGKDKKEVTMKIGDQMYQEGGVWKVNGDTDSSTASEPAAPTATDNSSPTTDSTSTPEAAPAPSANLGNNDILKRLMEKRAKENQ